MERRLKSNPSTVTTSARLWLAARQGRRLAPPRVAPLVRAELPMMVEFEGLTADEQRKALDAFPGGRRFVLLS